MSRSYKKQPYRKSRAIDKTCRCNDSCNYCHNNRLFNTNRKLANTKQDIEDYYKGARNGKRISSTSNN